MSAGNRSPTPPAATDAERSLEMPRSSIEYTVTDPTTTAYDVFKAHEHLGEIYDVKREDSEKFTVTFVSSNEQAATASDDDVSLRQFADSPDQQSPANIMNALNDDCFMEIFERSDTRELYALAHVCTRFRSIAVQVFQSKNRKEAFSFEDWETTRFKLSLSVIVNFIRIFRPTRLIALYSDVINENVILQAMTAHCPKLTELDISHGNIDPETFVMLRPFFPHLRKIEIRAKDILDHCGDVVWWQLEELRVQCRGSPVMPNMQMPRLRKLIVAFGYDESGFFDPLGIFEFLARNSQVTELKFEHCHFSWKRLCALAECVPNIERLSIFGGEIINYDESRAPSIFKCLTMCEINCCHQADTYLRLLHGAPLKHLDLRNYSMMDNEFGYLIDSICRLTTISSLYLHPSMLFELELVDDHLVQITSSLRCLRELLIGRCNFTLACIRDVLSKSNGIIKLDVSSLRGLREAIDVAVLTDISAIIAARSELHVKIRTFYDCAMCVAIRVT